jgi:hypothetical protein
MAVTVTRRSGGSVVIKPPKKPARPAAKKPAKPAAPGPEIATEVGQVAPAASGE